jgi:hypothetical protein
MTTNTSLERILNAVLLALLMPLAAHSGEEVPKVKPEDMPEFVSIGAVTTFEQICLLTYSNRQGFQEWQQENEGSKLEESNKYKEDPTDETYRIATPLVSFIINASKKNSCTVFSSGTDRDIVEQHLVRVLRAYAKPEEGGKLKIEDNSRPDMYGKYFVVLSPDDVSYIEVVFSDSVTESGVHRTALTGATRRRDTN